VTREALQLYLRKLAPGGSIAFHISNRYLDLQPVVAAAAAAGGWNASIRKYRPDAEGLVRNETGSDWIALSPSRDTLAGLVRGSGETWGALPPRAGFAPWTDDHSSVLPLITFAGI
jgi:hypothetical protein